ncbi:MAG: hypothetical protein FJ179_06460 [Gammaproteobacteria bacterium]|nr:hypothetical protein [Gammaproteobacteria bacterium]
MKAGNMDEVQRDMSMLKPMRRIRGSVALFGALLLAGCSSWGIFKASCAKPADFVAVVDNAPLKIPAGRDAPDTRAALTIPPLDTPEAPRPADAPCIDMPPKFTPAPPKRPQA